MTQFNENELGMLFNIWLEKFRRRKFQFAFFYIVLIVYFSIPSFNIPLLEYSKFRITAVMEQRALESFMFFYPRQSWADLDEINPNLMRCIVSMEDGKFFTHKGIDWQELEKSLRTNKRRKRVARGGSTLTMQLSKNLFLRTDKNIFRKAKEFLITMRIEKEVSKTAILRNYVNAVEWGDGIFGIGKAAQVYFKKDPSELTVNECSRLAAVIPSPLRHMPTDNSGYVLRRSSMIRGRYGDIVLPK